VASLLAEEQELQNLFTDGICKCLQLLIKVTAGAMCGIAAGTFL
jgi:hypothetical protein